MTEQQRLSGNAACLQVITNLFEKLHNQEITPEEASADLEKYLGGLLIYIPNHNSGRITRRIVKLIRKGYTTDEINKVIDCTRQYICKVRRRLRREPDLYK